MFFLKKNHRFQCCDALFAALMNLETTCLNIRFLDNLGSPSTSFPLKSWTMPQRASLVHLLKIYFSGITLTSLNSNTFNACEQSMPNVSNFLQLLVMEVETRLNETLQDPSWFAMVMTYWQRESYSCLLGIDKAKNNLNSF